MKDKDYFVLTTNVDHCFQKAGFDRKRLFYTQGDYGLFQCSQPCCQQTWDNENCGPADGRAAEGHACSVRAGAALPELRETHVHEPPRSDDTFVQDEGWYAAAERYSEFVQGGIRA